MTQWIVLPVKAPADCKTRLRAVLDDTARERLVAEMLAQVVGACAGQAEVFILGPHRHGLPDTIALLPDPGGGLNAALAATLRLAATRGVTRLTFVSADLPDVRAAEIAHLLAVAPDAIAIAPDRAGTGTNALSLPLPAAAAFRFGYGPDSFARHQAEAARLGLSAETIDTPGLAWDVDLPEDLPIAIPTAGTASKARSR